MKNTAVSAEKGRKLRKPLAARAGCLVGCLLTVLSGCAAKLSPDEEKAIAAIEHASGQVDRTDNRFGKPTITVSFATKRVSNADLEPLDRLENVQQIYLMTTGLTDAGLVHIAKHTELEALILPCRITDDGLTRLRSLTNLKYLTVVNLIEEGMDKIAITDDGLSRLSPLVNLETLGVEGTRVAGPGLVYLKKLPKLRKLELGRSKVSDAGLAYLKELPDLEELSLQGAKISDAGLVHLKSLTKLKALDLFVTQVTEKGVADLQTSLPHTTIKH